MSRKVSLGDTRTVLVFIPTYEISSTGSLPSAKMVNWPSRSVVTPVSVPFSLTVTPGSDSSFSSITIPVMFFLKYWWVLLAFLRMTVPLLIS